MQLFEDIVLLYAHKFGFVNRYLSKNFVQRMERDLFEARMPVQAAEYVPFCLGASLTLAVFSLPSLFFMAEWSAIIFIGAFAVSFALLVNYPRQRKRTMAAKIDSGFLSALRGMAVELSLETPFELSLGHVAEYDYGQVSSEFKKVLHDVENGSSIPQALQEFAKRTDSRFVKRGVVHLIDAYQKGGHGAGILKRLADEETAALKTRMKEYNGKVVVYSLFFIAAAAIMPAMFQALVIVGSPLLDIGITPDTALIVPVLVFPLINVALFALIASKKPW
jgi:flagellar protein FlaJ